MNSLCPLFCTTCSKPGTLRAIMSCPIQSPGSSAKQSLQPWSLVHSLASGTVLCPSLHPSSGLSLEGPTPASSCHLRPPEQLGRLPSEVSVATSPPPGPESAPAHAPCQPSWHSPPLAPSVTAPWLHELLQEANLI